MAKPPTPTTTVQRPPDPTITSSAHNAMKDRLAELRIVFGGTETLLAAGDRYLPQFEKEEKHNYDIRRKYARLRRNMFRQACERITGRIFEVPVKLNPPEGATVVPQLGKTIADDADMRGNSLDRVARIVYLNALKLGFYHVFVDYPVVQARNLAEERAARARPFLILLAPEQIIRCYEDDDGVIQHLAWLEETTSWDAVLGQEVVVRRVHEREPGVARVWTEAPRAARAPGSLSAAQPSRAWTKGPDQKVSQQRIMLHTLYAEKEDHMMGRTPLTEVKDLTIEHFQIASDYRNCLRHVLFPILTATGVDQKNIGNVVLGPDTILGSDNKDAKFGYLEHQGAALESGFKDLESLEQRAEAYAGRLTKPSGDVKATTEAISTAEVSSFAKDMALSLQDVLQAALDDCALWAGQESLGRVEVNLDFAVDLPDGDMNVLQSARSSGDISRPTLWKELGRRNVLSRDFDPDEEKQLLEEETAEAMEREQEAMRFASTLEQPQPGGGE